MAILQSTGIRGFMASLIKTGNKVLNDAGKLVDEYVENFLGGFAGHGWKIWEYTSGKYKLELDALTVRGTFSVYELLVQKVRAVKGALGITQGSGKIKSVSLSADGLEYLITVEDEMSFVANDFIRCQNFTGNNTKLYHVKIQSITDSYSVIHLLVSDFNKDSNGTVTNPPEVGDEIVQFGNLTDTARQSAIYLHADEGGQPAIDVMFGINSTDWSNNVKIRIGGEIPGSGGLKGFYCVNGMVKGVNESGHTTYCIYPDGSAMFGDGSAQFNADKSGYLAGGAISWEWNATLNKFVTTMGDVVLQWANLSPETQDNLKGEKGDKGDTGATGNPGENGTNGVDANLLPWVSDWNNNMTLIGGELVVSPKMFSGTKDPVTGLLTGIASGRDCITIDDISYTGIFALVDGIVVFKLDPINKQYEFTGKITSNSSENRIIIDPVTKSIQLITSENDVVGQWFFESSGSQLEISNSAGNRISLLADSIYITGDNNGTVIDISRSTGMTLFNKIGTNLQKIFSARIFDSTNSLGTLYINGDVNDVGLTILNPLANTYVSVSANSPSINSVLFKSTNSNSGFILPSRAIIANRLGLSSTDPFKIKFLIVIDADSTEDATLYGRTTEIVGCDIPTLPYRLSTTAGIYNGGSQMAKGDSYEYLLVFDGTNYRAYELRHTI